MLVLDRRGVRPLRRPRDVLTSETRRIEFLLELLLQLLFEIIMQLVFEIATALGWESLRAALGRSRRPSGVLTALGLLIMGGIAGLVSVLLFGRRLTPAGGVSGASLLLAPLATGLVMSWIGRQWHRRRGEPTPPMLTFAGGATFAGAMAIVRFVWIERPRWF